MASAHSFTETHCMKKENILDFVKEKYLFVPVNEKLLKDVIEDVNLLSNMQPLNDEAEKSLDEAKKFLVKFLNANRHYMNLDQEQ